MSAIDNLLLDVNKDSPFSLNEDNLVLALLLSECVEIDGIYYSNVDEETVKNYFSLGIKVWLKSIESLRVKGHIVKKSDKIIVGTYSKGQTFLYCNNKEGDVEDDLKEDRDKVNRLFKDYADACNRRGKAVDLQELQSTLSTILRGKFSKANHMTFGRYFLALQEVVFQRRPRKLAGKEYAQIKKLIEIYETVDLVKMINYYLINSGDFHDNAPNISYLLGFKDKIYGKLYSVTSKEKYREKETQDAGF